MSPILKVLIRVFSSLSSEETEQRSESLFRTSESEFILQSTQKTYAGDIPIPSKVDKDQMTLKHS